MAGLVNPPTDESYNAIADVILRAFAVSQLGELDLDAARAAVDAAAAAHDFAAHRRALLEEAAITLVLLKRMPYAIPSP